ncbi:hypothetical protein [Ornithinibacillus halotolerans]|uniref:Uncharacterized protein n=1 Tax=Ornithinibacillus halotolerans TaxID=1274357 RepID=A0A916RRE1_9BACI|nr:hypothetical protein [Ornithinibacillus halotolerans]GGA66545.1 hypothetical protein GCM10008025_07980 [Ornithinibacillus halotolerans]
MDYTNTSETLAKQGKNTVISMQNLKRLAHKKNNERKVLYEKFRANEHSFRVYTYMDAAIGQLEEVQEFLNNLAVFGDNFTGVDVDFSKIVDKQKVNESFQQVSTSFNKMAQKLGYDDETM